MIRTSLALPLLLVASVSFSQTTRKKMTFGAPTAASVAAADRAIDASLNSDCSEVDLNKGINSPFNKIPVYDQDGSSLCYSFATSQMVDYYRMKKGDKSYDLTNPVYAAWATYFQKAGTGQTNLRGGFSTDVNKTLKHSGVCSNEEVKSRLSEFTKSAGVTEAEVLHFLEVVYDNYGQGGGKNWNKVEKTLTYDSNISCDQQANLKRVLVKKGYLGVPSTAILQNLFKGCKAQPVKVPNLKEFYLGSDLDMKKAVDGALTGDMPAEINMCSVVFNTPKARGQKNINPTLGRDTEGNSNPNCGRHAVLVTGRKMIGGQCAYMIRNSWGAYWKPKGAMTCSCRTLKGEYKQACNKPDEVDEYVGCWFDSKDLMANVGSVDVYQ